MPDVRATLWGIVVGILGFAVLGVGGQLIVDAAVARLGVVGALALSAGLQLVAAAAAGVVASWHRRLRSSAWRSALVSTVVVGASVAAGDLLLGTFAAAQSGQGPPTGNVVLATLALWILGAVLGAAVLAPRGPAGVQAAAGPTGGDAGTGTVEYVGGILLAGCLVAVVLGAVLPSAEPMRAAVARVVCEITNGAGGSCGSPIAAVNPHQPTEPCVLSSVADARRGAVDVMSIAVEGGGTVIVEKLSDGRYRVSAEGKAGAGVSVGAGLGASVTVDDKAYGGSGEVNAAGYVVAGAGATWVVDGAEKDKLVSYLKDQRNWATADAVSGVGGAPTKALTDVAWGASQVWDWVTDAYRPSSPDEIYGTAGVEGVASGTAASLNAGAQGASGELTDATVLGTRIDTATGRTTVFYEIQVDASAEANSDQLTSSSSASATGKVSTVAALTIGKDKKPISLALSALAVGSAQAQVESLFVGPYATPPANGGVRVAASLDLSTPQALRVGADLLTATGVYPSTLTSKVGSARDAVEAFTEAARDSGQLTVQDVTIESGTTLGASVSGGELLDLGAEFANTKETLDYGDAYWMDNGGWHRWSQCAG